MSNRDININNLITRCRLMCGQEAEALGLPLESGYFIHDSIAADDKYGWSREVFEGWVNLLLMIFGEENESSLLELFGKCQELMGQYGQLIEELLAPSTSNKV